MPRPLKPLNPYASWAALFGATLRKLRLGVHHRPVVSQDQLGRRIGFDGSTVSAIERAIMRPHPSFVEACERELPSGGTLRAMFPLVNREWDEWERHGRIPPTAGILPPAELTTDTSQLADARQLEVFSDDFTEVMQLAREAETSHIGSATLDTIDRAVDRLARDYPSTPPTLLIPRAQGRLRQVRQLLNGKLTLAQHRHLLIASGWLAALLSTLQFDIGDRQTAEATRDVAHQLGTEAGDQHLVAWTFEFLAWFALVEGELRDSVDFSRAGFQIAPNSSAGVQLAVQEARAWARLGEQEEAEDALRRGGTALAGLPVPSHPEHHFVFDATKLSFYAAMIYTWLGNHEQAEEHAREVIAQAVEPNGNVRWPTRLAVARLDLGIIAAQRNEPDLASKLGIEALHSGRVVPSTLTWFADLDHTLLTHHPELADVRDFHEQYKSARQSQERNASQYQTSHPASRTSVL